MTLLTHTILSIGEVLWDLFPDGARFGGAPANVACHAAILGAQVSMISAVGDDQRGHEAIRILQAYDIDTTLVQQIAGVPTGAVNVTLSRTGEPTFAIGENSAWDQIAWTPRLESKINAADAIYFGTLSQRGDISRATIHRALDVARERGIRRVLDVNLRKPFFNAQLIRDSVSHASVLKLSDNELAEVTGACGIAVADTPVATLRDFLSRYQLEVIAMTRGKDGALLISKDQVVDQPGIPTIVRDTVGAGDSFTAAMMIGLLKGDSLATIGRVACEIAAAVCAQPGAVPERRR